MSCTISRLDVVMLDALETNKAVSAAFGLTIPEILDAMKSSGYTMTRMTVYRHLQSLVEHGYVAKGVKSNHADTFYILKQGQNFITKEI